MRNEVDSLVGEVTNHHKTDIIHLYDDRYRVNVWSKEKGLIDRYAIVKSYFIDYKDGILTDKTKK
jgi:hypothetical protein